MPSTNPQQIEPMALKPSRLAADARLLSGENATLCLIAHAATACVRMKIYTADGLTEINHRTNTRT